MNATVIIIHYFYFQYLKYILILLYFHLYQSIFYTIVVFSAVEDLSCLLCD